MKRSLSSRVHSAFGVFALVGCLVGCDALLPPDEQTRDLTLESPPHVTRLRVVDRTRLVADAEPAQAAGFSAAGVAPIVRQHDDAQSVLVSWISGPCDEAHALTIQRETATELSMLLERSSSGDACEDLGIVYAVVIRFAAPVPAESIRGRTVRPAG